MARIISRDRELQMALRCGLSYVGTNGEDEMEYVGTQSQWTKFEELKEANNL